MTNSRLFSKQSGNTIGGVILGLIAGLAIAVIIALYITRSPTPFVDRTRPPPESFNDRSAASSNAPDSADALKYSARIIEIPPPPETASQISEQRRSTPTVTAPNVNINPSRTTFGLSYYLQIGVYKTQTDAERQRAQLALRGFEAQVSQRASDNLTYYRVWLGPFKNFEEISDTRQRLSDAGIDSVMVKDGN